MSEGKSLEGLQGWLILVGFGVIFAPLRIIITLLPIYKEIFENNYWQMLTTPGTDAYNILWAPILLGEISINILLVIAWVYIAYLFFTKKKQFPKIYISIVLFTLFFIILDALAIKVVLPSEPIFDKDTVKELSRSVISAMIWIPYMLISKRVKATFIH